MRRLIVLVLLCSLGSVAGAAADTIVADFTLDPSLNPTAPS